MTIINSICLVIVHANSPCTNQRGALVSRSSVMRYMITSIAWLKRSTWFRIAERCESATSDEIHHAYRMLARRFHPDADRTDPLAAVDLHAEPLRVRGDALRQLDRQEAAAGDKSPTHPALDGVWARLQDANMPFMLHVGAGAIPIERAWLSAAVIPPSV